MAYRIIVDKIKNSLVSHKRIAYNRGITYQMKEKDLTKVTEYFVGVVKIACYCLNKHVILPFI